jgi:site-specific DNA-methyltransferase (adenine-specific)
MKPYYEEAGITIYHGDCELLLERMEPVDLLLTDPPYGIGRDGRRESTSRHGGRKAYEFYGWDSATPSAEVFSNLFAVSRDQVIWGGNYFASHLPATMGWLVWDKCQRIAQSDGELAFTSRQTALRIFTLNRVALMTDRAQHPTQKPIALMKWCISLFPQAKTVLDPFCGSGSTLLAAKDMGMKAVGIEFQEKYCEIAANRLRQSVFNFKEQMPNKTVKPVCLFADAEGEAIA